MTFKSTAPTSICAAIAGCHRSIDKDVELGVAVREKQGAFSGTLGREANLGVGTMSRLSWLQKVYWTRFSKPVADRQLVKFLIDHPIKSLLEIGVGDGARIQRIAKLIQLATGCDQLRYIGVDEFESSPATRPHLSLKQAHQLASQLGLKASLIPGAPAQALARVAHKFGASDLIIISDGLASTDPASGPIGSWLNRLAHNGSTIFAANQVGQPLIEINKDLLELTLARAA